MLWLSLLVILCADALADSGVCSEHRDELPFTASGMPQAVSLLAVSKVVRKSDDLLVDETVQKHAEGSAWAHEAQKAAVQKLQAVKDMETTILLQMQATQPDPADETENAENATDFHANKSFHFDQIVDQTENATKCRLCGEAETELISSLKSAHHKHLQAQTAAVAMNNATNSHEVASETFETHHSEFKKALDKIKQVEFDYNSAAHEFENLISWAQELHQNAKRTESSELGQTTAKAESKHAAEEYARIAAQAQLADNLIGEKQVAEEEACVGIVPQQPDEDLEEGGQLAEFVKVTAVFGLGFHTLDAVHFYDEEDLKIPATLANYQDEWDGSWIACGLNDGNEACWWEACSQVYSTQANHMNPGPPRVTCADGASSDAQSPGCRITVEKSHQCTCTDDQYKGHKCAYGTSKFGCHWFIFRLQHQARVSRVGFEQGCGNPSGLSYVEFSACTSADVATCSDAIFGSGERKSLDEELNFPLKAESAEA